MARAIDADRLKKELAPYEENDFSQQIDVILKIVDAQPTLTQPNELLTCEGCVYLEELTVPCAYCTRMKREVDYYLPPEGEEETP